jgi:hypothetical protein
LKRTHLTLSAQTIHRLGDPACPGVGPLKRPAGDLALGDPMLIAAIKNRADRLQRSALPAQNAQFGATPTITGVARREVPNGGYACGLPWRLDHVARSIST